MTLRAARVLHACGLATIVLGLAAYHARVLATPTYSWTGTSRFPWTLTFGALLAIASYGVGLPEVIRTRLGAALSAVAAVGASVVALSLSQLVLGQPRLPRAVVFGVSLLFVPFATLCSGLVIDARSKAAGHDRVVVVGDWADAATLSYELEHGAERAAQIVDVLTPAEAAATRSGELPLCQLARSADAEIVVLDRKAQLDSTIVEQVAALHESGVRVRTLSLFYEEWLGKLPMSELERVSLMFDIGEIHRVRYGRFKRVSDVVLASVGAVGLAVVLPFVVAGNAIANRGPLFYRQQRVGKGGAPITLLKFRTMRPDPDAGSDWTAPDDPRITPFGRVLRRSHLDELPQMLNILRGDLSTVGPRPEQPQYVLELSEKLPFYPLRHLVRPGLTGWAQVKYRYGANEAYALEKLQYEFYYLRHQRLPLDLRILLRTIRHVLRGGGR
jgi:lipopolysaccharide/colanic/teichoic acid biosynthesis glycosyltransferase